jgi:hypothetical protein
MAHIIQKPDVKTGVALVLRGERGSGKGLGVAPLAEIIGSNHYWHIDKLDNLTGQYTHPKRAQCILGFADECYYGGNPADANALKNTITEDEVDVNIKHIAQFSLQSYINLLMATNEKYIIGSGKKERRFQMVETNNDYAGPETPATKAYFDAVRGVDSAVFAQYLRDYDISNYSPRATIETEPLKEQQVNSLLPLNRWWHDCLTKEYIFEENPYYTNSADDVVSGISPWPISVVAIPKLILELERWCTKKKLSYNVMQDNKTFMSEMRKMVTIADGKDGKKRTQYLGKQVGAVMLPTLQDCRTQFVTCMGWKDYNFDC